MPIPDYQTVMLPLLRYLGDGREHTLNECVEAVGNEFKLTPEERLQFLPSAVELEAKSATAPPISTTITR